MERLLLEVLTATRWSSLAGHDLVIGRHASVARRPAGRGDGGRERCPTVGDALTAGEGATSLSADRVRPATVVPRRPAALSWRLVGAHSRATSDVRGWRSRVLFRPQTSSTRAHIIRLIISTPEKKSCTSLYDYHRCGLHFYTFIECDVSETISGNFHRRQSVEDGGHGPPNILQAGMVPPIISVSGSLTPRL